MTTRHHDFIFILFIILMSISSGCDNIYKSGFVPIPAQTVAGPVEIGSQWMEIVSPQPLEPNGATNWIQLGYAGYEPQKFTVNEENILNLADGRSTRIEAFLFDDKGEIYELQLSQTSVGPQLGKKGAMKMVDGKPDYSETRFPGDRKFTKLKIRSEIPLKCEKIEWIGSNPK